MTKFPENTRLAIVDELFDKYTIGYDIEDNEDVLVYCETCEAVACTLKWDDIAGLEKLDLYEAIIDAHKIQSEPAA